MCGSHVGAIFEDFRRFLEVFAGFWTVLERHVGFYRFLNDLGGFGSIWGQFWEAMLEPVWRPRGMEIGKMSIFV